MATGPVYFAQPLRQRPNLSDTRTSEAVIIEIAIGVLAGSALAFSLARHRRAREGEIPVAEKLPVASIRESPRGLAPGDVLIHLGDEVWLESALTLFESGHFVGRLLAAPNNSRCEWVLHLDEQARHIVFLNASDRIPQGMLPSELPHDGFRHGLHLRARVSMEAQGPVTRVAEAELVVYRGPAGRVVVSLRGPGLTIDCAGEEYHRDTLEFLPGDSSN